MRRVARFAVALGILSAMVASTMAGPLDSHRWKNRLILVSLAGAPDRVKTAKMLTEATARLRERDVVVLDLSAGEESTPGTERPSPAVVAAAREAFKLDAEGSSFVLVGKDGGEKARQRGRLDLPAFLRLIDSMPMRQEEARREARP